MSNLAPTIHRSRGLDQNRRPTFHIIQSPPFGLSPIATRPTMLLKMVCKMAKRVTNGDNNQPRTIKAQRTWKVSCFQEPGSRSPNEKEAMATRINRSVGNPTAAVMRRTWRFLPSSRASSIQLSGMEARSLMGGFRAGHDGWMTWALHPLVKNGFPLMRSSMGSSSCFSCSEVGTPST